MTPRGGRRRAARAQSWSLAHLDELCAFPTGGFDDQVDASSGAFQKVVMRVAPAGCVVPFKQRGRFGPGLQPARFGQSSLGRRRGGAASPCEPKRACDPNEATTGAAPHRLF